MKEPLLSVIVSLQEKEEKQIEKVIDSIINSTYNEYVSCDFYRTMVQRGISTKSIL